MTRNNQYKPVFDNAEIESEYCRWVKLLGDDDPYVTNELPGIHDVLRAHFLVADYFCDIDGGLGGVGPKSLDLLHSAMYRPFVSLGGVDKWNTAFERIATLIYGIIKDHAFHDANKRTGLLTLLLFLNMNGRVPTAGQKQLEDFAVDIADNKLDKYSRYESMKKKGFVDVDVRFIADYLERNSRKVDRTSYSITYRELDSRLHSFGYRLENPSGNYIDLVRIEEKRKIFGWGAREKVGVKILQVGFPGWKSQVNHGAMKSIRKAAKLTVKDGFDSKTFYEGSDPLQSLIAEYAAPLERLAYR